MKYLLLIATAVAGLAVPAHAEDLSGFRVEARGGWERMGADATLPNPDDDEDTDGDEFLTAAEKDRAFTYGVELGYDLRVGAGLILGAYAGADWSEGEICAEIIEDDALCAASGRTFTVGARAGVPLGERVLVYAKGGYSNGKLGTTYDGDITDNDDDEPGEIAAFSDTKGGFHVGGGFELGLTSALYTKIEYLYTDFGSRSHALGDADAPVLDIDTDRHQVLAGIGLRF